MIRAPAEGSGPHADFQSTAPLSFECFPSKALGPEAEAGKEKSWIQTVPGKGWFPLIRFFRPLPPFFDGGWKPDDIVALD